MRSESEMMSLIIETGKANDRVRAVYMNGSRANPKVERDMYQDFDIVYVVTETEWFVINQRWISVFGETAIVQEPDKNDMAFGADIDASKSYGWLMLFRDGNRIDLHVETVETALKCYGEDKLTLPLLDKDGILPQLPPPTDEDYRVKRPTQEQFHACCNNFWWCLGNVAKGIKRDQLSYAMWMYNVVVRDELSRMLDWHVGVDTGFTVSSGMAGKYYKKYLPAELYGTFVKTYSDGEYENLKKAVFAACDLFHEAAAKVGGRFGFAYAQHEEDGMRRYLAIML